MNRSYQYASAIERKIAGHLKSLGFNIRRPPADMTISRKVNLLNYLRTIRTTCEVVEEDIIKKEILP
ncbi:MAG: hypothetical protein FVQ79_00175 [Planctomycetes bacterium]|nr:hypothetical protein [Planctomycetota bacterium]